MDDQSILGPFLLILMSLYLCADVYQRLAVLLPCPQHTSLRFLLHLPHVTGHLYVSCCTCPMSQDISTFPAAPAPCRRTSLPFPLQNGRYYPSLFIASRSLRGHQDGGHSLVNLLELDPHPRQDDENGGVDGQNEPIHVGGGNPPEEHSDWKMRISTAIDRKNIPSQR
jgi:hypothetical protein